MCCSLVVVLEGACLEQHLVENSIRSCYVCCSRKTEERNQVSQTACFRSPTFITTLAPFAPTLLRPSSHKSLSFYRQRERWPMTSGSCRHLPGGSATTMTEFQDSPVAVQAVQAIHPTDTDTDTVSSSSSPSLLLPLTPCKSVVAITVVRSICSSK